MRNLMSKTICYVSIVFILLNSISAMAVEPLPRFEQLSIDNGLSQNSVYNILKDSQGFMWFGTEDGLNRYDGYQFKHFRHDSQDRNSLSGSSINALLEDNNNVLWVGTTNHGLNRFDRKTEQFTRFVHDPNDPHSLSNNHITSIAQDNHGQLWIGTRNGGLNRFDPTQNRFERVKAGLSRDYIRTLLWGSDNKLWVGSEGDGLKSLDVDTGQFANYLPNDRIRALSEDKQGNLWIATKTDLYRLNHKTQRLDSFRADASNPFSLKPVGINRLASDIRGGIWIGFDGGGLGHYDPKLSRFTYHTRQSSDRHSLSNNDVQSIYHDQQDLLWVGTMGGGVGKLDLNRRVFGHYKQGLDGNSNLSHNNIRSLLKDSKGVIWVGADQGGVNRYESDGVLLNSLKWLPDNPNSLSHNNVVSVVEAPDNIYWIGTLGGGLNRYDNNTQQFSHYRYSRYVENGLNYDWVRALFLDSKNLLWIATWGGGLNRFDASTQHFEYFTHQAELPTSLSGNLVQQMFEDNEGHIWVATTAGLNRFDNATGQFERFLHDEQNPNSLSNNDVLSIQQDAKGTVWVGNAGGGLHKYNAATNNFTRYREKDGLTNDTVYGILEDNQGYLWLSTNNGLSRFDPTTASFRNYDVHDGLQSNEFNSGAFYKGDDGELFFGGINGYNRFFPQHLKQNEQPPKVVFTDFLLFNQSVPINNAPVSDKYTLPGVIEQLAQVSLGYQQSLVTFEFAALDFRHPMKNSYRYKLEGLDNNWITVAAKIRQASYTNLPTGHYTLRVQASNAHGYWNEQGTSIDIKVNPPMWRSWWAYVIYGIVLAIMVYFIFHYQLERIHIRQEREKIDNEHRVIDRLKQVDKLKEAFLANTSHELRTPLNGIIGLAESLLDGVAGQLPAKADKNLAMVVTSGKRLAHLINDILDLSKLKHSSIVLQKQPLDLHALFDVVLMVSAPLLANKDVQLINSVPNNLPTIEGDETRLLQIMHNLVGNAIKFTESGSITLGGQVRGDRVKVTVHDTGIGISKDKFDCLFDSFEQVQLDDQRSYGGTGLGLTITRQLVELHGGKITVKSKMGQGSTFAFDLPMSFEKPQQPQQPQQLQPAPQKPLQHKQLNNTGAPTKVSWDVETIVEQTQQQAEPTNEQGRFRLLLVDDEPINLQVLNNHLSRHNYQLVEAQDGLEALELIENNGPFDLVLLDIMMPKMSGYKVCTVIRERYSVSELPVIFLTAKNQVDDLVHGFFVGANDHLTKPIDKHELLSRVATHLKLLDINRNLERLVSERTEQLETKNQQILAAQEKLVLSEKLASLGTLMAGVAHEIKNPTNFIHVSAFNLENDLAECLQYILDLAGSDAPADIIEGFNQQFAPLFKHIDVIKDGSGRINTIVKDLKTSSYMVEADKSTVCITDALMSTVNLIKAKYQQTLAFETDFAVTPSISCYPAKLNQVFMNLLINACDALENVEQGKVVIGCDMIDGQVQISIKDNGCGMSDDVKSKLFEPFFTTKGMNKGTGLGLSISYDIVHKHGGELSVESQLGVGSVFRITLPV